MKKKIVIPLGDSVPSQRRPLVTYALIAACVLVFGYELTLRGVALDRFIERWGAVPRVVLLALAGDPRVPRIELVTLVTSEFLHAGFLHLGGNMLFLWVFGRAVEDRVGHAVYLGFYLLAGALAGLAQSWLAGAGSTVPLIGASGAIAGVLGVYFVAYPTAWVRVLVPVLFFFWTLDLPAVLVLAFWFLTQFVNGVSAITRASSATDAGVAVWAHVSGFLLGALGGKLLPASGLSGARGRVGAVRRADTPGPARLVSSLADLLTLLLVVRLAVRFVGLTAARSPLAALANPIVALTNPLVEPFAEFVPAVRVGPNVLEVYTLVAILTVYVLAGLVGQLVVRREA